MATCAMMSTMKRRNPTRRQFIQQSASIAGAAVITSWALPGQLSAQAAKRTAIDSVELGKTGIKLSRLGIGTGSNNGAEQLSQGKEYFIKTIRHAYDRGIRYFDCAEQYATFPMMAEALNGFPRDSYYLQSKIWPREGQDVTAIIDQHRRNFKTDYIDTLLIHCRTEPGWTTQWRQMMDLYDQAKQKKWIRARGVSCHSYPALQGATATDWVDVHLVRVNPQGKYMDGSLPEWGDQFTNPVPPVLGQIKLMHEKGRGVIGMKIYGNGSFTEAADRDKSLRFALGNSGIDAIVIGMKSPEEVDDVIAKVNGVLAAA